VVRLRGRFDGDAHRRRPAMRQELIDLRGRVRVDAEQDVAQVLERIDAVEVARRDQRVQAGEVVAAVGVADEQEVLSIMRSSA